MPSAPARRYGGISLAPQHVRLESTSVADLPGFGEGRWWVQDLAASLPARLIPAMPTMCSTCAPRRAARRCSWPRPARRDRGRLIGKSSRTTARESRSHASPAPSWSGRCADLEARTRNSTRSCSTRPARRPAPSAAIPKCSTAPGRKIIAEERRAAGPAARPRRAMAEAGRFARLFRLLARTARKAKHVVRAFLARQSRLRDRSPSPANCPIRARRRPRAGSASCPACSKPKAGSTASSWRALSARVNPV